MTTFSIFVKVQFEVTSEFKFRCSHFLKPRQPVHLVSFNVRTVMDTGKQMFPVPVNDSPAIDIYWVREARAQD